VQQLFVILPIQASTCAAAASVLNDRSTSNGYAYTGLSDVYRNFIPYSIVWHVDDKNVVVASLHNNA